MLDESASRSILQSLQSDIANRRLVVASIGILGDPAYVPWLLQVMEHDKHAWLAGEAVSFISGVDLGTQAWFRAAPDELIDEERGSAEKLSVELDPDAGLAWADRDKLA